MFSRAFLRTPGANVHEGLTTAGLGSPDFALMLRQHAEYRRVLEACGVVTTVLEADLRYPDSCFIEDTAVIADGLAVITRPGAPSRRGEVDAIAEIFACRAETARIEPPGTVDGGDVIVTGKRVLIGVSQRTNEAGATQLADLLRPRGFDVRLVPVISSAEFPVRLHLKSDVCPIGDRLLATRAYVDRTELADFAGTIFVPDGEEYAANCLDLGNRVLIAAGFPRTRDRLERAGFAVEALDLSEFRKMDGALTCLSLRF